MASQLPPVLYAKSEINGILVRPDSRSVLRKAIEGHPVEVTAGNDYINLYHVFERMQEREKKRLRGLVLVRKQIDNSRWHLFVTNDRGEVPDVELRKGYDPKRGRYKRYAEQLAAGDGLRFSDRAEAIKARRAWQLYVRANKRAHLRATLRRVGKSDSYVVCVVVRE